MSRKRRAGKRKARVLSGINTSILKWLLVTILFTASLIYAKNQVEILEREPNSIPVFAEHISWDTVIVLGPEYYFAVENTSVLNTVRWETRILIEGERHQPRFSILIPDGELRISNTFPASVTAGIRLDETAEYAMTAELRENGLHISVILPEPEITSCEIDFSQIPSPSSDEAYFMESGYWTNQILAELEIAAKDSCRSRAIQAGILNDCRESTTQELTRLLLLMGASEVQVSFNDLSTICDSGDQSYSPVSRDERHTQ